VALEPRCSFFSLFLRLAWSGAFDFCRCPSLCAPSSGVAIHPASQRRKVQGLDRNFFFRLLDVRDDARVGDDANRSTASGTCRTMQFKNVSANGSSQSSACCGYSRSTEIAKLGSVATLEGCASNFWGRRLETSFPGTAGVSPLSLERQEYARALAQNYDWRLASGICIFRLGKCDSHDAGETRAPRIPRAQWKSSLYSTTTGRTAC